MLKKKGIVLFISTMVISIVMAINIYAVSFNPNEYTSVDLESRLLAPTVKQSMVSETAKLRGDFFMKADLIIKDNGNGDIGAFAKAFMAVPVDEVYITVYLDRWDADTERWRQVTFYDAEFYASDYPDGLSDPSIDVTFKNQDKGYYYRIRGVLAAVLGGKFEGFSPVTAGILIE